MLNFLNRENEPIVENDLILTYIKCKDCGYIGNIDDWLGKSDLYCPECYRGCKECKEIYLKKDVEIIVCDIGGFKFNICKKCLDTIKYYFCNGCEKWKCNCILHKEECYDVCDDCDCKYCFECSINNFLMECVKCKRVSCCKRFCDETENLIGDFESGQLGCNRIEEWNAN